MVHQCSNCGSHDTNQDFSTQYEKNSDFIPSTFICNTCGNIDNVFPEISVEQIQKKREEHFAFEQASALQVKERLFSREHILSQLLMFIAIISLVFSAISFLMEALDVLSTVIILMFGAILLYVSYLFRKQML